MSHGSRVSDTFNSRNVLGLNSEMSCTIKMMANNYQWQTDNLLLKINFCQQKQISFIQIYEPKLLISNFINLALD